MPNFTFIYICYFKGLYAIIFCVNLSSYDLMLPEDENMNQMMDSMRLFDRVCNNRWLVGTPIILLLNKTDLFRKKILHSPLTSCFPDYNGHSQYEDATSYIQMKFEELNKSGEPKTIFTHLTCALDTQDIELGFDLVTDDVIEANLNCRIIETNIEGCEIC